MNAQHGLGVLLAPESQVDEFGPFRIGLLRQAPPRGIRVFRHDLRIGVKPDQRMLRQERARNRQAGRRDIVRIARLHHMMPRIGRLEVHDIEHQAARAMRQPAFDQPDAGLPETLKVEGALQINDCRLNASAGRGLEGIDQRHDINNIHCPGRRVDIGEITCLRPRRRCGGDAAFRFWSAPDSGYGSFRRSGLRHV